MQHIEVHAAPLEKLADFLTPDRSARLMSAAQHARELLAGRVVWNVNSTALGGGVAEMLQGLLAYGRGARVDTRWLVVDGDPEFFRITKALHNALHGSPGGAPVDFGAKERRHYEAVLHANLGPLRETIRPGDIVLLHDPQTAGLVEGLRSHGAHVVWRSHVGRDRPNTQTERAWDFLHPYVATARLYVFSREEYAPAVLPSERVRIIAPSIDPFAEKNRMLEDDAVAAVLRRVGLVTGEGETRDLAYTRRDGTQGLIRRHSGLLWGGPPPRLEDPLVVQVSRWDRLKDMTGVLAGFVDHVASEMPEAHLVLAGPDASGVTDDPEGAAVLASCQEAWGRLPDTVRARCHLATLPMDDSAENALIVNALQRHAAVVVQKSLVEGFGLTLTEAMWKSRPVVASAVGGLQDQLTDGVQGRLLHDPADLAEFGGLVRALLADPAMSTSMGRRGHERVRDRYLGDRQLIEWVGVFDELLAG